MSHNNRLFIITAAAVIIIFSVVLAALIISLENRQFTPIDEGWRVGYPTSAVRAEVQELLRQEEVMIEGELRSYPVYRVQVLEGDLQGKIFEVDYGKYQYRVENVTPAVGDQILIDIFDRPDGVRVIHFIDFIRTPYLLAVLAVFVVLNIAVSGWKGFRGLIGLGFSFVIIIVFILPEILDGKDPLIVTVLGSFVLLTVTQYLIYGWTLKTHTAVLSILVTLIITITLANFFTNLTRLTGLANTEVLILIQQTGKAINPQGLVLASILIGTLGILDDLIITQASVVFELKDTDPNLSLPAIIRRSMRIGQDHVAATVNTLFLAYAGAALPMLLMFTLSQGNFSELVNLEFVAEEVIRTLVGSMGLILAAPISTAIASLVAHNQHRFGKLRPYLGPANQVCDHH